MRESAVRTEFVHPAAEGVDLVDALMNGSTCTGAVVVEVPGPPGAEGGILPASAWPTPPQPTSRTLRPSGAIGVSWGAHAGARGPPPPRLDTAARSSSSNGAMSRSGPPVTGHELWSGSGSRPAPRSARCPPRDRRIGRASAGARGGPIGRRDAHGSARRPHGHLRHGRPGRGERARGIRLPRRGRAGRAGAGRGRRRRPRALPGGRRPDRPAGAGSADDRAAPRGAPLEGARGRPGGGTRPGAHRAGGPAGRLRHRAVTDQATAEWWLAHA